MTNEAVVAKIRPVSWKVCVPGEDYADYVRNALHQSGFACSKAIREPDLQEPPTFSFVATPKGESPLTAPELQAILDRDGKIKVVFDA